MEPRNIYADVGGSGTVGVQSRNGWRALSARLSAVDVLLVQAIDWLERRRHGFDLHPERPGRPGAATGGV